VLLLLLLVLLQWLLGTAATIGLVAGNRHYLALSTWPTWWRRLQPATCKPEN